MKRYPIAIYGYGDLHVEFSINLWYIIYVNRIYSKNNFKEIFYEN